MNITPDWNRIHRVAVWGVQLLLGVTFIVSGFAKLIDPTGTFYKITDYLTAFGWQFFQPALSTISILLPAFELMLGVNVLLGTHRKSTSILVALFMAVMTPFTLYILIANPVSDCGCFGDLFKLTNFETFAKNVVLLVAALYFLFKRNSFHSVYSYGIQWLVEFYVLLFSIGVGWFMWIHLPLFDLLPFKIGVNITHATHIPDDAPQDEFTTTFIYEKDGVQKEFTVDNYPEDDSTWIYVSSNTHLIRKGFTPAIEPFQIVDKNQNDITASILNHAGYSFLLTSVDLAFANEENTDHINALYDYCMINGYGFYGLTASPLDLITEWEEDTGGDYPIYQTDATTLRSMVRSNPGLILMKDGVILRKWSNHDIPAEEHLTLPLEELRLEDKKPHHNAYRLLYLLLTLFVPLLIVFIAEKTILLILGRIKLLKRFEERKEEIESSE